MFPFNIHHERALFRQHVGVIHTDPMVITDLLNGENHGSQYSSAIFDSDTNKLILLHLWEDCFCSVIPINPECLIDPVRFHLNLIGSVAVTFDIRKVKIKLSVLMF